MKKIYSFLTLALFAVIVSCTDDDLDPLNFKKVSKGTLLALRGDFLNAIYNDGVSGALFVPLIADGTEVFTFDGEYLAGDPTSLESIDVYAEDADGNRTLLKNISSSEFKTTADYPLPWVTVSFTLDEILKGIGVDTTYPMDPGLVDELLDTYKAGIPIVTDLNLKDGSKVLADDLVAAGLYQSNQFYPAQRLPFDLVKYCTYDDEWSGQYKALEIGDETYGPYFVDITQVDDNKYEISNIYNDDANHNEVADGEDYKITITLSPSTDPFDQDVTVETVAIGANDFTAKGSYEMCGDKEKGDKHKVDRIITLSVTHGKAKFTYQFKRAVVI